MAQRVIEIQRVERDNKPTLYYWMCQTCLERGQRRGSRSVEDAKEYGYTHALDCADEWGIKVVYEISWERGRVL